MNQSDWLTCDDPVPMLEFLNDWASERKIRVIACAIIRYARFAGNGRTIWDLLPETSWYGVPTLNSQTVVESAERCADGLELVNPGHLHASLAANRSGSPKATRSTRRTRTRIVATRTSSWRWPWRCRMPCRITAILALTHIACQPINS